MIKAKKSLGQNFLTDRNILEKITNIVPIKDKHILEVGPGTGNLTSFILKNNPKKMFVIEKDNQLANNLDKIYNEQITIINNDILSVDEKSLFKEKVTVFGNLPYNISTEILASLIMLKKWPPWYDVLILMFQKEVADRILAKPYTKEYGRLSILSNWRLEIKKHFDVSKNCFFPNPNVDSTILSFKPKKKYRMPTDLERQGFEELKLRLGKWRGSLDPEALQGEVYSCGRERFNPLRDWFSAIYEVLLGASQGPRFGGFIALYVAWFFYLFRFYAMPYLLGYDVWGMLAFPLESDFSKQLYRLFN